MSIWNISDKLVKIAIGNNTREALYKFGIREKQKNDYGDLVIPDYYYTIKGVTNDNAEPTKDELIELNIKVRKYLNYKAEIMEDYDYEN